MGKGRRYDSGIIFFRFIHRNFLLYKKFPALIQMYCSSGINAGNFYFILFYFIISYLIPQSHDHFNPHDHQYRENEGCEDSHFEVVV